MFSPFEENNDSSVSSAESVVLQSFSNFPRNLAPNFRLYTRERPAMTFHDEKFNEGQNKERKIQKT